MDTTYRLMLNGEEVGEATGSIGLLLSGAIDKGYRMSLGTIEKLSSRASFKVSDSRGEWAVEKERCE